jgi:hypothetical protein
VKTTATIYVTLKFHLSFSSALTSLRVPKPHFGKQFWITAGTFLSIFHTTSKQGAFGMRISCNRKSPGQEAACTLWCLAATTTGIHASDEDPHLCEQNTDPVLERHPCFGKPFSFQKRPATL